MNVLSTIPSRIKYYLLEWKDSNMEKYLSMHPDQRLNDLSLDELHHLFSLATAKDSASLLKAEKELGVSDAPDAEHGVYADVRNLECEAHSTEDVEHTSSAALETRIDSENFCRAYSCSCKIGKDVFKCSNDCESINNRHK